MGADALVLRPMLRLGCHAFLGVTAAPALPVAMAGEEINAPKGRTMMALSGSKNLQVGVGRLCEVVLSTAILLIGTQR